VRSGKRWRDVGKTKERKERGDRKNFQMRWDGSSLYGKGKLDKKVGFDGGHRPVYAQGETELRRKGPSELTLGSKERRG